MVNRMILNETAYFGEDAITKLPAEFQKRGYKKALILTDKTLIQVGLVDKVTKLLDETNSPYTIFDGIIPNPTIMVVKLGLAAFYEADADCIIAIGGGSAIDTAKAIGIIAANPEFDDCVSLEGEANTKHPSKPILAVPTTSGTAAEVTINYVITDENKHRKFVCADPHDIPVVSFVDSKMMLGMPKSLAAATGMDAMTHAIEGFVTKGAWEMTNMLHLKAIEIVGRSLRASVSGDLNAREEMALGQYIAGMGFSNVGLGLVHGMAHPLSAWYDIPHGVACAALLPSVMEWNKASTGEKYRSIALALGIKDAETISLDEARTKAVEAIKQLSQDVGIPSTISELGVKAADIPQIAEDALRDVCTPGNPREATLADIIALYQSMM